jgi:serine/threonine protein phosphatase PrpC
MAELSGCTGTILLVQDDILVVANAGDSPVFIFRDYGDSKLEGE